MIQPAHVVHPSLRVLRTSRDPDLKRLKAMTIPAPTALVWANLSARQPRLPPPPRGACRDAAAAAVAASLALGGVTAGVGIWALGFVSALHGAAITLLGDQELAGTASGCHYRGLLAILTGCALLLDSAQVASQNGALLVDALALAQARARGHSQASDRHAEGLLQRARRAHAVKLERLKAVPMLELCGLGLAGECIGLSYGTTAKVTLQVLAIQRAYLAASAIGYASLNRLLETPGTQSLPNAET